VFGRRRERFLATYAFPSTVEAKLAAARNGLGAADRALVMEGLRDWFAICRTGRGRTFFAMPSAVVDDAWHEFILSTREYREFCRRALGRYLDHTPSEGLPDPGLMEDGMRATWRAACALEGIDDRNPDRLPRIFATDAQVGAEDGYRFRTDPGAPQPFRADGRTPAGGTAAPSAGAGASYAGGAFAGCGGGPHGGGGDAGGGDGGGGGCGGGCGGG
jgi:hypothetical protein